MTLILTYPLPSRSRLFRRALREAARKFIVTLGGFYLALQAAYIVELSENLGWTHLLLGVPVFVIGGGIVVGAAYMKKD